jgi:AraC-like DNA-binding protein
MILFIKNMITPDSERVTQQVLDKIGVRYTALAPGQLELPDPLTKELEDQLSVALGDYGQEVINDRKSILVEKIKIAIISVLSQTEKRLTVNFPSYLSDQLHYSYTHLARIFSQETGSTLEQFIINCKIERAKEMLSMPDVSISEIAYRLHYSNVAHLSNQFKKVTGLRPSEFKRQLKG